MAGEALFRATPVHALPLEWIREFLFTRVHTRDDDDDDDGDDDGAREYFHRCIHARPLQPRESSLRRGDPTFPQTLFIYPLRLEEVARLCRNHSPVSPANFALRCSITSRGEIYAFQIEIARLQTFYDERVLRWNYEPLLSWWWIVRVAKKGARNLKIRIIR